MEFTAYVYYPCYGRFNSLERLFSSLFIYFSCRLSEKEKSILYLWLRQLKTFTLLPLCLYQYFLRWRKQRSESRDLIKQPIPSEKFCEILENLKNYYWRSIRQSEAVFCKSLVCSLFIFFFSPSSSLVRSRDLVMMLRNFAIQSADP